MISRMATSRRLAALVMAALCSMVMRATEAMKYTVGGASGWVVGEDMKAWAAQYTFHVGDELYFPYAYGQSSVLLVTEDDYDDCNTNRAIASDGGMGDMAMTLLTAQTYFFISGHADQCTEGLHLQLPVQQLAITQPPLPTPSSSSPSSSSPDTNNNNNSSNNNNNNNNNDNNIIPSTPVILTPPRSVNNPYSTYRSSSSSSLTMPSPLLLATLVLTAPLAFIYLAH